jgi:two-component system NtrC family sensor kinase
MKTEFDVHEVLTETISFLKPEVKHSTIEISTKFMPGPLHLNSDRKLLGQVFVNFITNAIHAVREKHGDQGHIEIRTREADSEIEICFEDNGTGISAADRDKIFELFYSTKPPGKGTGLGLPICQNIINKLKGKITLQSEEGVGTTFFVHIPIS